MKHIISLLSLCVFATTLSVVAEEKKACKSAAPKIAFYKLDEIGQESQELRDGMRKLSEEFDPQFTDIQKQMKDTQMQMQEVISRKPTTAAEQEEAQKQFETLRGKMEELRKKGMELEKTEYGRQGKLQKAFEERIIKARNEVKEEQGWNVIHECSTRTTSLDPEFDVTAEIKAKLDSWYKADQKAAKFKKDAAKEKKAKKA